MNLELMHRQLLDPACYPEPTHRVEYRETHISRVYLTDRYAYKLKKPLSFGFLDYSTLERRGFFCTEELRLNRRFAPGTYLDVVELRADAGRLRINGPGQLIDYAVRMRRLPDERMLDRMIEADSPELPGEIERLGRHLALLLDSIPVCRDEDGRSHAETVRALCEENLAQTGPLVGPPLLAGTQRLMTAITARQLDRLEPLFLSRETRGYVREGHGDLHARNICMTDPVQIYDCIEFCRGFRIDDVAAEIAFLLMDLEFRGRRDLARRLLGTYQGESRDPDLDDLLIFYKSYRAWVRGKVEALLAGETEVPAETRQAALERARRYFSLALGYHAPQMLLLTTGLMGVGKSTLALALATALGAELLRSDVIRKELAAIPAASPRPEAFGEGLYSTEMTARTYGELRRRTETLLRRGHTVIVDASFAHEAERRAFFGLAGDLSLPARLLHLRCDPDLAMKRLDLRFAEGRDPSDGRRELFATQAATFDPPGSGMAIITIDSSAPVNYNVQHVICRLMDG